MVLHQLTRDARGPSRCLRRHITFLLLWFGVPDTPSLHVIEFEHPFE